jgi:hypothetical protein
VVPAAIAAECPLCSIGMAKFLGEKFLGKKFLGEMTKYLAKSWAVAAEDAVFNGTRKRLLCRFEHNRF